MKMSGMPVGKSEFTPEGDQPGRGPNTEKARSRTAVQDRSPR